MDKSLPGTSDKGADTPVLVSLLTSNSSLTSKNDQPEPELQGELEGDIVGASSGKSSVLTCASSAANEDIALSSDKKTLDQLTTKPWRKACMDSNGFHPTMNQQGLSSPLSITCMSSVINTNYYDSHVNYQRKHSYQEKDDFNSRINSSPEKIQKMSADLGSDKLSGMKIKSPSDGLKAKRYNKTAEALKMSGLMDITMKTAELLKKNKELQKEMDKLKRDSKEFLQTVLDNPENHQIRDTYFSHLSSDS